MPISGHQLQISAEHEVMSAGRSDSMVTLEGNNRSKMEAILTKTPHGSTAVIEKNTP